LSSPEIESEQRYLDVLYARLDELERHTESELVAVRLAGATGTPAARSERDAFASLHESRLAQLRGVEERLCFGRLDVSDGTTRYIGRLGLFDDEQTQLLVDWRAPAAREFYQATSANPGDVVRRRHLETRGRVVTGVYDDVLRAEDGQEVQESFDGALAADGVLLAALNASRTGRMSDIVATIQSEQDQIIRSELSGAAVVQGGPGTGKTAVALHRAAYLLYTHRDRLASTGVLLVGPTPVFLRYISQVLPSLGETGVVTATPETLFPGVRVSVAEPDEVVRIKGQGRMASVVATAIRNRQRAPTQPETIHVGSASLAVRPRAVSSAIESARRAGRPHNLARHVFVRSMLDHLTDQYAHSTGRDFDAHQRADFQQDLRDSVDIRRVLNLAWPPLTATGLLRDLFASPERVFHATPSWTNDERELLLRERSAGWSVADVPLLDEAAQRLGVDDSADLDRQRAAAAAHEADRAYAREALQGIGGPAAEMVSAESLAERFGEGGVASTVGEIAAEDRSWTYGHIIVDEAQEMSAMMWRLLARRCRSGSMTVVGDVAQTGSSAGATSWQQMLQPVFGDQWRSYELSVNYRTPRQFMELAGSMLREANISVPIPTSVRDGKEAAQRVLLDVNDSASVASLLKQEWANVGAGRLAIITSDGRHASTLLVAQSVLGEVVSDEIESQVAVLTAAGAKGLEFDAVVVLEPGEILHQSTRGAHHLYVALTRATQRLVLAHQGTLPAGLTEQPLPAR